MLQKDTIFHNPTTRKGFNNANPLDFNLFDDEGQQAVYILNDQAPGRTQHLVIFNNGDDDLVFQSTAIRSRHMPAADNHHFELRFRPGTIDPEYISWLAVGTSDWRLRVEEISVGGDGIHDGTVAFYLLYFGEEELVLPAGKTLVLILHHVKAGVTGGSRGSRMELRYHIGYHTNGSQQLLTTDLEANLKVNLLLPFLKINPNHAVKTSKRPIQEHGREMAAALMAGGLDAAVTALLDVFLALDHESLHYRQERLQVVSNRGKKELPMMAAFEGSSTVLNDGETANHLTLQVSNFLQNNTIRLGARDGESPTKFILSFDTSEEPAAWALCDADDAAAIDIELHFEGKQGTNWHIRPELQGESPQWIITLIDDIDVQVGEYFHLHLSGLKTNMPSGFTKLYLLYENIPGFWDGRFEVPVEKSPLKFDDQKSDEDHREDGHFIQRTKVGIGNTQPVDTLDVNGGIRSETLVLRNGENVDFPLTVEGGAQAGKLVLKNKGKIDFPLDVDGGVRSNNMVLRNGDNTYPPAPVAGSTPEKFPLDVNGTIRAKGLKLEGDLSGDIKLNTKSLELSESITIGAKKVVVTEEGGNLKVAGRIKDSTGFVIPPGGIIMWSGKTVPQGWKLCDGTNNTPDLRGRFIVGYNGSQNTTDPSEINDDLYNQPGNLSENGTTPGNKDGKKTVTLTVDQMPSHNHDFGNDETDRHFHILLSNKAEPGDKALLPDDGFKERGTRTRPNLFWWGSIVSRGGDQAHENRPPYYVLAFIMKT